MSGTIVPLVSEMWFEEEKIFYFFEKSWSKMKSKNRWKKRVKWTLAVEWRH